MPISRFINASETMAASLLLDEMQPRLTSPQPTPPPVELRPQLFLVETYRLRTQRTATGKGPLAGSISFLPGEEKIVEISTSITQSKEVTDTTTAMESMDETVADNLNNHVKVATAKSASKDTVTYDLHGNFHGDAEMTFGGGETNASLDVHGGCNTVRNSASKAVEGSVDSQIAHTAASRKQTVSESKRDDKTQQTTSTVSRSTVKNPNPTRTANFLWFQLVEQYTSFLALESVELAFRNGDKSRDEQVPLHDADELLDKVLDPGKVTIVRDAIKAQLQVVLDYQDEPINIVEEVAMGSNKSILRLKRDLQSKFILRDNNGNPIRQINIDGVLIRVFSRTIPSRTLVADAVVGQSDVA